jgi:hypothetical protein
MSVSTCSPEVGLAVLSEPPPASLSPPEAPSVWVFVCCCCCCCCCCCFFVVSIRFFGLVVVVDVCSLNLVPRPRPPPRPRPRFRGGRARCPQRAACNESSVPGPRAVLRSQRRGSARRLILHRRSQLRKSFRHPNRERQRLRLLFPARPGFIQSTFSALHMMHARCSFTVVIRPQPRQK